jgi:hypothetical protein
MQLNLLDWGCGLWWLVVMAWMEGRKEGRKDRAWTLMLEWLFEWLVLDVFKVVGTWSDVNEVCLVGGWLEGTDHHIIQRNNLKDWKELTASMNPSLTTILLHCMTLLLV